jgi:hypothetical protein
MLYRSSWVAKGAAGNTHGYSTQTFLGSLAVDAFELPIALVGILSDVELDYLEAKIFRPARLAEDSRMKEVERHSKDPIWRLDEAVRLSAEAAVFSELALVPNSKVSAVHAELAKVRTISPVLALSNSEANMCLPPPEPNRSDPLREALVAIKAARDAVNAGRYGKAPAEGVRATYAYRTWAEIFEAIEGAGSDSLLRSLQSKGFAKTRGK